MLKSKKLSILVFSTSGHTVRGAQFTLALWSTIYPQLGCELHHTTAYHSKANGLVERFHRTMKAALNARLTAPNWFVELP